MNGGMLGWIIPVAGILGGAVGWLSSQYWQRRHAKRQASHDAGTILKERKTLLEEMISKIPDAASRQTLTTQLEEVNSALLGLYGERLRHTLKDAGLPPEEMLVADGRSKLQPQEVSRLREVIAEINALPPFLSTEVLRVLGNTYYFLERYEDAKSVYDKILNLNPYDHVAFRHRGAVHIHMKKYEDAIADFNRSLELKPGEPIAIHDRGIALKDLGEYEAALEDFNHALESMPNNPIILQNRGVNYIHMKRYEDAFNDLKKSLELEKDHARTYYDMAYLLSLWIKPDDAFVYLAKAIQLGDKYREMAKTDKDFDNIRDDPRFKKLIESD